MQEKKREDSILKDKKLGLSELVEKFCPKIDRSDYKRVIEHTIIGCTAIKMVAELKLVFTNSELKPLLSTMPASTYEEQLQLWGEAKEKYESKKSAGASRKALKEITNKA